MKKIVITAAILLAGATAFAQKDPQHGGRSEQRMEKLKTELQLSDEQYNKIKTISEEHRASQEKQRKAAREEWKSEVKEVLNKEQLAKFEEMEAKMQERQPRRSKCEKQ